MNPMDRHPADDLISQYLISSEPYYRATGTEIELSVPAATAYRASGHTPWWSRLWRAEAEPLVPRP
jgi:hypothetical protein